MKKEEIRKVVRKNYGKIAKEDFPCCGQENSQRIGYTETELKSVPEGANFSLGCGNPIALASLKEGETVLDLGSGGGLDCFLAARKVGEKGKVIGVDMTTEMLDKARENARKGGHKNVEFRLGEIENLPVADSSVDVIISNCVINLSPDKKRVFEEAFRALRPGGRVMVSDIVLLKNLPEALKKSKKAYTACVSGAMKKAEYLELMKEAGFLKVEIMEEAHFSIADFISDADVEAAVRELKISNEKLKDLAGAIASIKVSGIKPE